MIRSQQAISHTIDQRANLSKSVIEDSHENQSLFKGIGQNHKRAFDKSQDKAKQSLNKTVDEGSSRGG